MAIRVDVHMNDINFFSKIFTESLCGNAALAWRCIPLIMLSIPNPKFRAYIIVLKFAHSTQTEPPVLFCVLFLFIDKISRRDRAGY